MNYYVMTKEEAEEEAYYKAEEEWMFRSSWLLYLEASKIQVNPTVEQVVGNKDLRRFIAEFV